ncbi:hypothetical protein TrLO_g2825 [Triparma laevis f. longispina]|uniref:PX domain-containing protein n=1 Tax=Triparma laevis f. longispina TaxID=1714387 RepID=A0A9W7FRZ9_9STRA|nr:hypothetical protein TrLO_g2825 [Triparma laevis f. longispina]
MADFLLQSPPSGERSDNKLSHVLPSSFGALEGTQSARSVDFHRVSEKLEEGCSAFKVPPLHSCDLSRIKFELSYEEYTWWIQKKHTDFEELDAEVKWSTTDSRFLSSLPKLPRKETVLTLFGSNHSNNIVKRCRKLCKYLRGVLCSKMNGLPYLKIFLKLKMGERGGRVGGRGGGAWHHLSNFQGYLGSIVKEGSFEVCVGCSTLESVSYFKRRYAALVGGGLFMYRHHDDLAKDHVSSLVTDVFMNGVLHAERIKAGKRRKGGREEYAYWRIWVEDGFRFGQKGYVRRQGRRGSFSKVGELMGEEVDSRWSCVCRGTERMCADWLEAVSSVGVVLMSGGIEELVKIKQELERKMGAGKGKNGKDKKGVDSMTETESECTSGSSGSSSLVESESEVESDSTVIE